jgi:AAA family ATP:ADP antiporter
MNSIKLETVYYSITSFFIAFFVIFTFILYPNQALIHPDSLKVTTLAEEYPYIKWFILIYGKWSYACLYITAELWVRVMFSLLFWQFANQITKTEEAKRFYPTFGLIGNFSIIITGMMIKSFAEASNNQAVNDDSLQLITLTMSSVIVVSFICMYLYRWMNKYLLTDSRFYTPKEPKAKKAKPSFGESLKTIFTSKYLGFVALLVLSYGIAIDIVEGPWKDRVKELYPTKNEYAMFMGSFSQWKGLICIVMFFISGFILRRFSWKVSILVTPIMISITGFIFYIFVVFPEFTNNHFAFLSAINALNIAVIVGAIQNVLSKAVKYTLFDATKEMAYIPIDDELKTKGKAAVDVVGGSLGRSGGAIIQSSMFTIFPAATFATVSPFLMVIFVIISALWIFASLKLNKMYEEAVSKQE